MAAIETSVVVCTYPARDHADELVAVLRKEGITTVVVLSDRHAGEWDVLVPARVADRANQMVSALLAFG